MTTSRRRFLGAAGIGVTGLVACPALGSGRGGRVDDLPDSFPSTDPALVGSMVGASHFSLERVEELLRRDRSLALARIDWGFGDWETALGAASHVGRREIVEVLLGHGARANLFTLAMLDRVDAVRAVCEAVDGIQRTRGPHGITLLDHARAGGAARTEEYLTVLGGADEAEPGVAEAFEGQGRFVGRYEAGERVIEIGEHSRGWLGIVRAGGVVHTLRRTGALSFSPTGAPHVRVVFETEGAGGEGAGVTGLSISGGAAEVVAVRVGG